MPSHQAGDLLVAFAFRDGSTTAPTIPSGWELVSAAGANTCWGGLYYKVATSGAETSGTWTSASLLSVVSYRPATGKALGIGSFTSTSGASTSVSYGALAMAVSAGSSWVAGVSGHRSVNTTLETAPTGMTNVAAASAVNATAEIAWHDTNGTASSWSTQSVSVGGTSSGWRSYAFEIVETTTWSTWDKNSRITLSGSNLTATMSSAPADTSSVRATLGRSSGKYVFKVTWIGTPAQVGVANASANLNDTSLSGQANACNIRNDGAGNVELVHNGTATQLFAGQTIPTNGSVWVGKDFAAGMVSVSLDGTTWSSAVSVGTTGVQYPLIGLPSNGQAGTIDGNPTFTLSGFNPWDGAVGYTLAANGASIALTSPAVGLKVSRVLSAQGSTLALTGQAVGLRRGYTLAAQGAGLSLSAGAAGLKASRTLNVQGGALGVTASAVGLRVGRALPASGATISAGGQAVALRVSRTLPASGAALSLAAGAAGLRVGRVLAANGAGVSVAAQAVGLVYTPVAGGYTLAADGVSLSLGAGAVRLAVARRLQTAGAVVDVTAGGVGLSVSRRLAADGAAVGLTSGASLRASRRMAAEGASVGLELSAVGLIAHRRVAANGSSVELAAGEVVLTWSGSGYVPAGLIHRVIGRSSGAQVVGVAGSDDIAGLASNAAAIGTASGRSLIGRASRGEL